MAKFTIGIITVLSFSLSDVSTLSESKSVCPLWHVKQMGKCKCVANLKGHIECHKDALLVYNMCLTWDNKTDSLHAGYCLFIPIDYSLRLWTLISACTSYDIIKQNKLGLRFQQHNYALLQKLILYLKLFCFPYFQHNPYNTPLLQINKAS